LSSQLISVFLANTPIHLDGEAQVEGEPKLLWKVVLRTGTWKMRPGPGGVKLKEPLKILRDKAPKGHISMADLVKSFQGDDKGPAKENVTLTQVHADGTTSDGGFVRKLTIQDVPGEDGSGVKESLLWAGIDVTDSGLKKKLEEKSIVGCSGGILFDYTRPEDAKKFGQILSHVMATNSPWINGTGGYQNKLPEGVMAAEPDDLPIGEVEFESRVTEEAPNLPVVQLDDPPAGEPPDPGKATGKVVWKPEQGFRYVQDRVQKTLRQWREQIMANIPATERYSLDWPYYHADDVTLDSEANGTALISSGYGAEADSWVAAFKLNADREVEIDPFVKWTPAKQEWVAASEEPNPAPAPTPPSARPAGRHRLLLATAGVGLQEAQAARAEYIRRGIPPTTITGGSMGLMDLLSGVDLSDEQREALLAEERRTARLEESEAQRRARARQAEVAAYCGETKSDGTVVKGKLDDLGLGDPGVKKFVRNALLSDDGGAAIAFSVHLEDGTKTTPVEKTSSDLIKEFIDLLPKSEQGRANLSEQARRLPDDAKPPEENEEGKLDMSAKAVGERSEALLAELTESGYDIGMPVTSGSGS
jgi:hypothetical protein